MHTHTPISEIARALANRAEDISVALLGEPTSRSRKEYRWGRRGWVASLDPSAKTIEEEFYEELTQPKKPKKKSAEDFNGYQIAFRLRTDMAWKAVKGCEWLVNAHKSDAIPPAITKDIAAVARTVATAWAALALKLEATGDK
jgi:hypothetical protein